MFLAHRTPTKSVRPPKFRLGAWVRGRGKNEHEKGRKAVNPYQAACSEQLPRGVFTVFTPNPDESLLASNTRRGSALALSATSPHSENALTLTSRSTPTPHPERTHVPTIPTFLTRSRRPPQLSQKLEDRERRT